MRAVGRALPIASTHATGRQPYRPHNEALYKHDAMKAMALLFDEEKRYVMAWLQSNRKPNVKVTAILGRLRERLA